MNKVTPPIRVDGPLNNLYLLKDGKTTTSTHMEGQYVCKFCGSSEIVYQQGVNDASCQECGKWQNDNETGNTKP